MILSDKWVNFSQIQYFFNVSVLTLNKKRVIVGRRQKYSCYVLHVFIVNNSKGCYHNNNPEKNYNIKKNDQAKFSDRSNRENTQKTGTIFLHPLTGVPCATVGVVGGKNGKGGSRRWEKYSISWRIRIILQLYFHKLITNLWSLNKDKQVLKI